MVLMMILLFFGLRAASGGSIPSDRLQTSVATKDMSVVEGADFTINCTTGGLATQLLTEPVTFQYTSQETPDAVPDTLINLTENSALAEGIDGNKYMVSFSAQSEFSFFLVVKAASLTDTGVYTCVRGTRNASTFVEVRSKQDVICTCPDGYIRYGNSCFRFYHQNLSWPESSYMCDIFGSELAHIESHKEYEFIQGFATDLRGGFSAAGFWIGATSVLLPGHWHWKHDLSEVNFNDLSPLVESNSVTQDCLFLSAEHEFAPRGETCGTDLNFICKTKVSKCL